MDADQSKKIEYVAFLRGINVGGNKKIEMSKLKKIFESLNFTNVSTYINSGNVIFSDNGTNQEKISQKIEKGIMRDFEFEVKVLVRDRENLLNICKKIPSAWESEVGMRTHIIFLWKEIDNPDILKRVLIDPKVDGVKYTAGALLWSVSMDNLSRSAVYKFISTKIAKQVTVRSVNTVRKLNQMMTP